MEIDTASDKRRIEPIDSAKWLSKLTKEQIKNSGLSKNGLENLIHLFLRTANDRYLRRIDDDRELDTISEFVNFTTLRKQGEIKIRIVEAKDAQKGLADEVMALETCMADQRFITDTVQLCIAQTELREEGWVHATIPIRRDKSGKLISTADKEDDDHRLESVTRFLLTGFKDKKHKKTFAKEICQRLEAAASAAKDYQRFRKKLRDVMNSYDFLSQARMAHGPTEVHLQEANELLEWILDNNFIHVSLLDLTGARATKGISKDKTLGATLNLSKNDPTFKQGNEFFTSKPNGGHVMHLRKSSVPPPFKNAGLMDMLLLRQFDEDGHPDGGMILLGMFTRKAMAYQRSTIPYLKNRLHKIMDLDEVRPQSSAFNSRVKAFNTLMIDYLFECEDDELNRLIHSRIDQESRSEASTHIDIMPNKQSAYALLAIPHESYSDELIVRIKEFLCNELGAKTVQSELEGAKGQIVPIAFYFSGCSKLDSSRTEFLEAEVIDLCTPWHVRFRSSLREKLDGKSEQLYAKYAEAFPFSYEQSEPIEETVSDVIHLEKALEKGEVQFDFLPGKDKDSTKEVRLRLYRRGSEGLLLSEILPIMHNIGFRVLDEIPTLVTPSDQSNLQIDTFRLLVDSESGEKDYVKDKKRLINGLDAIFGGCIPSDTMNRLMLRPGLGWNDVDVLRSYMRYSIQIGPFFDSSTVDRILCQYPDLTDCLVEFFHAKFNPKLELKKGTSRADYMKKKKSVFLAGMDKVRDSTEDRVFRVLFNLMEATVRTNAFRPDRRFHYLSFKFDCAKLDHCPEPRPLYEIYVRHAEMEGCHLRSGLLARGGLRWSDRLDDYRTEIFGLMRAQKEKNVLIVPQGAKGGFTVLGNPQPGQDWKAYGDKMYKVLIRGMLDITDNQIEGKEVRPPGVVCHDPFDPYLVVAADKGTAHLSDTANGLALEYGFWLGDAFASGGSAGYDHKAEGITAKGAWTCVRHHFGKLGVDPERDVIRVVGIGDLSGDVFGNGMMLSKTIKLVGAFNHRDIFLDPDPDCAVSFIERQRMFALPRSGWTDYDKKVISKGGGVFPRSEKSLPLSPQIQKLLGTEEKELSPEEVIQKLLTLDVDLIYNGGLGTYIKSSQEAHADVGDKSNDSVRVDACDIRARVVGEGGNLGVTQKGRIEYALNGGYINTDAIDNSAGVDCSDREVNLKVLFGPLVASGKLNNKERDEILEVLTPEVLAKILKDNDAHALCLSLDEIRSKKDPYQYLRTMDFLSEKGVFNPKKEDLPTIEDLQQRGVQKGYARPELSKLMAFFKMYAKAELLRMDDFSFPLKDEFLKKYFPQLIYEKYHGEMSSHILIRELLATLWIGDIVNDCGSANFADLIINSERSVLDVAYAYTASKKWMKAEEIKQRILACNEVPMSTRFQGIEAVEEGVKTASSWALHFFSGKTLYERIGDGQEFESTAKEYHEACASVMGILSSSTSSVSSELFKRDIRRYESMKFPHDLAWDIAASTRWSFVFPVAYLARKMKTSPDEAAEAYLRCGQVTGMHGILLRMAVQSSSNRWEVQALRSLLASLRRTILNLSERVLEVGIDKVLSRDPSIAQVGEEIAKLHANPLDPVPVPFLVVMGEKLHKAVTRDFENGVNTG